MTSLFTRFLRDDSGATAIEYGLIVAMIFLAITVTLSALGDKVEVMWQLVHDTVTAALS
jgi:pilus assembly protein Flp/PilA